MTVLNQHLIREGYLIETSSMDEALAGENTVLSGTHDNLFWRRYPGPNHSRAHVAFKSDKDRDTFDMYNKFEGAREAIFELAAGRRLKVAELPERRRDTPFAVLTTA